MKAKRKTIKEAVLQGYVEGFNDCLTLFEEKHRGLFWNEYYKRKVNGLSTLVQHCTTPQTEVLWEIIDRALKILHKKDEEYKKIHYERFGIQYPPK